MPTFTVQQVTAARAFLGCYRRELADASGLECAAISIFELEDRLPKKNITSAIRKAFRDAGVDFYHASGRVGLNVTVQCDPS